MQMNLWTTDEIEVIRQHYPSGGATECMKLLPGRTALAIQSKAKQYKIVAESANYSRKGDCDERELIVGEIRYMINLMYDSDDYRRQKTHALLDVIIERNTLDWWHSRRKWALGRWMEALIRDYDWTAEREVYKQRVRDLHVAVREGSFEDFI